MCVTLRMEPRGHGLVRLHGPSVRFRHTAPSARTAGPAGETGVAGREGFSRGLGKAEGPLQTFRFVLFTAGQAGGAAGKETLPLA